MPPSLCVESDISNLVIVHNFFDDGLGAPINRHGRQS